MTPAQTGRSSALARLAPLDVHGLALAEDGDAQARAFDGKRAAVAGQRLGGRNQGAVVTLRRSLGDPDAKVVGLDHHDLVGTKWGYREVDGQIHAIHSWSHGAGCLGAGLLGSEGTIHQRSGNEGIATAFFRKIDREGQADRNADLVADADLDLAPRGAPAARRAKDRVGS